MQIVALDISLTGTGICSTLSPTDFQIKSFATIKTSPKNGSLHDRFLLILQRMEEFGVFDPLQTSLVGIEDYAFGRCDRGILDRAELRGIIRYELFKLKIPNILIAPQSMKKFVSGKGNTPKDLIPMWVAKKFATELLSCGLELSDDNQADAVGLAAVTTAYHQWMSGLPTQKEHAELFQKIRDRG